MKRTAILAWCAGLLSVGAGNQPPRKEALPGRPPRVWVVPSGSARPYREAVRVLEEELARRGIQVMEVDLGRFPGKEPPRPLPAACVAVGTKAALRLHKVLPKEVLFSFCLVSHPEALGILEGRPFLGLSTDLPLPSQLELARQVLPWARKVGLLFSGKEKTSRALRKQLEKNLPQDWTLTAVDVNRFDSRAQAIEALLSRKPDLVWTFPDPSVFDLASLKALLLGALRRKIPVYGFSAPLVRSGALLGPYLDPKEQARTLAEKLGRRLRPPKGEADPPPEGLFHPRHLYTLNLNVAARLGILVPSDLVKEAKFVFGAGQKEGGR